MLVPSLGLLFVLLASISLSTCVRVSKDLHAENLGLVQSFQSLQSLQSLQNVQHNSKQNATSASASASASATTSFTRCPDHCDSCGLVGGRCDPGGCARGFGLTSSGHCAKNVNVNSNSCEYQFGMNSAGDCVPCPENCFYCDQGPHKCDPGQCYHGSTQDEVTGLCEMPCEAQFSRNSAGKCVPCPENCNFCDGGASRCDAGQCHTGYVQHPITGLCLEDCDYQEGRNPESFECEPCPENCFYCDDGPSKCDVGQCYHGYRRNSAGLCEQD